MPARVTGRPGEKRRPARVNRDCGHRSPYIAPGMPGAKCWQSSQHSPLIRIDRCGREQLDELPTESFPIPPERRVLIRASRKPVTLTKEVERCVAKRRGGCAFEQLQHRDRDDDDRA